MVGITGFGEVHLRAHPRGVSFPAVARLEVIGRRDAHRRRRLFIPRAPAERLEPRDGTTVVLLEPDAAQDLHRGLGPHLGGCFRRIDSLEKGESSGADGRGQPMPFGFCLRS
jgi:hypothetical protein